MRIIVLALALSLCVGAFSACTGPAAPTEASKAPTEAPTQTPTEAPAEAPTEAPTEPDIDPMDIVGTWDFAYTEIEGDTVTDGDATLTISGTDIQSLRITFEDAYYPDESFTDKTLRIETHPMYEGCGNDEWVMLVDYVGIIGNTQYAITLLENGMLLMQYSFTIEDMPMVSYQYFTRSE